MKWKTLLLLLPVLFGGWDHGCTSNCSSVNGVVAQKSGDLINAIAVNTHIYQGGVYSTSNITSDFTYLGIAQQVRDYPPQYFSATSSFNTLATAGVKFDFNIAGEGCGNSNRVATGLIPGWVTFQGSFPSAIQAVEGPNEINNQPVCYLNSQNTNNTTGIGNSILHFSATPAYAQAIHTGGYDAGMIVSDTTNATAIPSSTAQSSTTSTTLTMSATAVSPGVGNPDAIQFEANSGQSNTEPANNAAAVAYQSDLFVQSRASLTGVSVINYTGCCVPAGATGTADFNNMHYYPTFGSQPLAELAGQYSESFFLTGLPMVVTETGYYTAGTTPGGSLIGTDGVDAITQARYSIYDIMDLWALGIPKIYLYELIDECSDPGNTNVQCHFGLFDNSNSPKTLATTIKNFAALLSDGGSFTPGKLDYMVSGLPAPNPGAFVYGGHQMLFQKSNGNYYIVLWYEAIAWGFNSGDQTVTPVTIPIETATPKTTINIYDPVTGSSPTNTYSNTNYITVSLGADPIVVEVIP